MIAGFSASNHPQQTARRGAVEVIDDRRTDPAFFATLSGRFGGFTLDAAASAANAKCPFYFDRAVDGLTQPWSGRVWCNPPYSDCRSWVSKALKEWESGRCEVIVLLLPANRTEQGWWQELVEPRRDRHGPLRCEFLPGRMRFDRPEAIIGPKGDRPPFGCCLLIWGPG